MKKVIILLVSVLSLASLATAKDAAKDPCESEHQVNCGLTGSIEERISDCESKGKLSNRSTFDLVTTVWVPLKNDDGSIRFCREHRIYQQIVSKKLWMTTDRNMDQSSAVTHCLDKAYGPRSWPIGMSLKWRLPTYKEMGSMWRDPNSSQKKYWTSTTQKHSDGAISAVLCDKEEGCYSVWTAWNTAAVQCIADMP